MKNNNKYIPVCEPLLSGNEAKYINEAVETGWISSSGKFVKEFEKTFAEYCGVKYGVSVCNGTAALHLCLVASGIKPGDEVIIPDFTMISTAFAVCYTGAKPIFVDADFKTWDIDVNKIEEKISSNTKAIIPVHIFGNMCNMDKIMELAKKYNLLVIEDAAEAHGAEYKGEKSGSFSNIAAFSFYANKNITTGEGGMIVTNNEKLYNRARYFKNLCFSLTNGRNYLHDDIGFNYRMSNLHAAIGLAQVEKADYYRDLRIRNNKLYKKFLSPYKEIIFQTDEPHSINVNWMNAILIDSSKTVKSRDELMIFLGTKGIETRLLFNGMHVQESLKNYGCDCSGDFSVTEQLAKHGLYLPSGSGLSEENIKYICNNIISFFRN